MTAPRPKQPVEGCMKLSDVYRSAAVKCSKIDPVYASCYAINEAAGRHYQVCGPESDKYSALFAPQTNYNDQAWGEEWGNDTERRNCRVLALCFMAAIAESEGL